MESPFLNGGMIGVTLDYGAVDQYIIGTQQVRDTLVYVGGMTVTTGGATTGGTHTFALTGGVATTPAAGDLVIVAYCIATGSSRNPTMSITGYTEVFTEQFVADTYSTNFNVYYKFMGATPDTSFTRSATGTAGDGAAIVVHVWRNVDQTTPLDVTPIVGAAADSILPNASSITPVTTNAVILVVAGGAYGLATTASYTASTLSNFRSSSVNASIADAVCGIGSFAWTSGAYDPAAWTWAQTDSTSYSHVDGVFALRPQLITVPIYGNNKNSGMWNLEASYDYALSQYTAPSQVLFTTTGTQSWTVPVGITEISAVCIGGGGGGAGGDGGRVETNGGGGGGGLAYGTIAVTPGETLTIVVGAGGTSVSGASGTAGGASSIARGVTVLLQGGGGGAGQNRAAGGSGGTSTGTDRAGGGTGGAGGAYTAASGGTGGGGAGGYSTAGGAGGLYNAAGVAGTSGSAGGGGGRTGTSGVAGSGGGVGVLGSGTNGSAGTSGGGHGGGGSGGTNGSTTGGSYGGGGGGATDVASAGYPGGQGAVRIIWGPGRAYPSTNVADVF